jgi:transposase
MRRWIWQAARKFKYQSYGCATKFKQGNSEKVPELWANVWIRHYDNAPAHKTLSVTQFLGQKSITKIEPPPHSPDLAAIDFWLFPKTKSALKWRHFQDTEDIQKNVTTALKAIPQQEFQKCFQKWQHRWTKCVDAQGEYFRGDPSQYADSTQICLQ